MYQIKLISGGEQDITNAYKKFLITTSISSNRLSNKYPLAKNTQLLSVNSSTLF